MTYVRSDAWPAERRERLLVLVEAGLTAREAAIQLETTRSAVLGFAHRNGIKFLMTERKASMGRAALRNRAPKPMGSKRFPEGHAVWRSRGWGERAFTDQEIAVAIAARLAGASRPKAGRMIGASAQSLAKNWETKPELMAKGVALYEAAKADAVEVARQRRELEAFRAEAERIERERINDPILHIMPPRHRSICEMIIAGATLQKAGDAHGVTRERIRQIVVRYRAVGLVVPNAIRPVSEVAKASWGLRDPLAIGRKPNPRPAADFWAIANASAPIPKKVYRISDEERARRSEHMRRVIRNRQEARA